MTTGYDRKLLRVSADALIIEAHRTANRLRKDNHLLKTSLLDESASEVHRELARITDALSSIRRSIDGDHVYPPFRKLLIELGNVSNNVIAKGTIIAQVNEAKASPQREDAIALIEKAVLKAVRTLRELADELQHATFYAIEEENRLLNLPTRTSGEEGAKST